MLLSDRSILHYIRKGAIQVDPSLAQDQLRPAGIRIHLGAEISVPIAGQTIDLGSPVELCYERHDLHVAQFVLEPGAFVLATTFERIKTRHNVLCLLEGRSTIARLGLTIHNTASFLDGSQDSWIRPVLEISNHGPLRVALRAGVPIGMFCFVRLSSSSTGSNVHEQYRGQDSVCPAAPGNGAPMLASMLEQRELQW